MVIKHHIQGCFLSGGRMGAVTGEEYTGCCSCTDFSRCYISSGISALFLHLSVQLKYAYQILE